MPGQTAIRRKLVIVGDGGCGKTSLLCVFAMGEFPREYHPTIFENYVAEIRLDGKPVQLALWDTAGQEEYERLRPLSYSKSHIILIAFALDTPDSLENVQTKWIEEVREICGAHIPVMLVGCKKDIRDAAEFSSLSTPTGTGEGLDERKFITRKRGEQMQMEIGARMYKECSSLRNDGVDDVFEAATRQAMLVRTPASNGTGLTLNGNLPGRSNNAANNWAPGVIKSEMGDRRKSTFGNAGGAGQSAGFDSNRDQTADEATKGCCVIL